MAHASPFALAKELESQLKQAVVVIDMDSLPGEQRELLRQIKRLAADARLDVRDYEYAETRAEQLKLAVNAGKRLERLEQGIVEASKSNLFSAVDVATLSAAVQQIIVGLE
ncbi:MAG TPA: hypothetical protein VLI54_02225 [Bacillota bacterium]|nr:hypothetical protein [Bacillota bacterium]